MISRYQHGFGLIEVLVSLLILAVGVTGIIKTQAYLEVKSSNALNSIEALYLAEEKIEYFRTRGPASVVGTILFTEITNSSEPVYWGNISATRDVTMVDDHPVVGAKSVTVTVSWVDRWQQQQGVSLETVISQYSEFD
ncbi:prepilin-type cleavage/methylation domain-containing protein [Photobacterium sanctipauli]|uniref:Prepilin-type cleavage/methylation domain-containing protein n=1 Tax=Photobacterium sanctipauli TaxID=1342794 RepID=A0A2T3NRM8_9GAMM|nr:prepilin-type N-terminal cleavage/methylation domain-containing protein [Photobacterium sanctipauli]PSW18892.1 prepilin-type cleavage/methylation domain-containing protein [Photobacterium sanctipauli]